MVLESPDKDVLEESVFLTEEFLEDMTDEHKDYNATEDYNSKKIPEDTDYLEEKCNHYIQESKHNSQESHNGINHTIDETNCMTEKSQKYIPDESKNHYENIQFKCNDYENINVETLKICDKLEIREMTANQNEEDVFENGNVTRKDEAKNLNVRELAIRFESPTEQKAPFSFEKFKTEVKYPTLERKERIRVSVKSDPKTSPKSYKLTKNSARSLDENAFVKEFGPDKDRRKSLEVREGKKTKQPDLNLNIENTKKECTTPTTENKISLIQRFNEKRPTDIKTIIGFETEKKLSRERIEKYKEERRNFLREKYSSQSFRSNPEQLTRIKIKKETENTELPKFERRNTVDLGQRMRFSLAKSANNLDTIPSPTSPDKECISEEHTREFRNR